VSKYTESVVPFLAALLESGWEITELASNGTGIYEVRGQDGLWAAELMTTGENGDDTGTVSRDGETGETEDLAELVWWVKSTAEARERRWADAMAHQ
jgi:hypothetical protein